MALTPPPNAYENNQETATAVNQIFDLLDLLFPYPSPDIFTLSDFRLRYQLTGLDKLAISEIERAQRINTANGDPEQTGLCEFHVGLIYFYWGDYRAAGQQFYWTQRHWALISNPSTLALAYFAEAYTHYLAFHYEKSMRGLTRAKQTHQRLRFTDNNENRSFSDELANRIDTLSKKVREAMQPDQPTPTDGTSSATGTDTNTQTHERPNTQTHASQPPQTSDPPSAPVNANATTQNEEDATKNIGMPISHLGQQPPANLEITPISGHTLSAPDYHWYQVSRRQSYQFRPDIRENDWLLIYMQPEPPSEQQAESQNLLVAYNGELPIKDSILLKPQKETAQRIYLTDLTVITASFTRENGQIVFENVETQIDQEKIKGVVVGIWRPMKQTVG